MKNIILIILVVLPIATFSQTSYENDKANDLQIQLSEFNSMQVNEATWQDEVRKIRYCLSKYRSKKLTGIWLTVGGGFLAGLSTGLYQYGTIDENIANIGYIGGGISIVAGYVLQITCNRWLKKAAIGPADTGIGVKVSF